MTNSEEENVEFIKKLMEFMTPEERMEVMGRFFEDYCKYCGSETGGYACHCTNDEYL